MTEFLNRVFVDGEWRAANDGATFEVTNPVDGRVLAKAADRGLTGLDPAPVGDTLMADERVRLVSFTGSTEVGKLPMRAAADTAGGIGREGRPLGMHELLETKYVSLGGLS
ncbi:MAG: aldehyde dehydrogenase family protein [Pseudonocardia sp.]|uniref:aldehyde dehydrogenase family protein n=1 Tax=unclassified Pseudonocardia TaxID=2619320 RepID=UPI000869D6C3|nr:MULTISPECIES: aldehyde dehydrogenase family protein [unclassified Pseudonocardia]MBN9110704.1 aldehyde dehydrogenase family protein [Pseudonocardia sp.]ODU27089.1 MAG: hypothetical protein ABS80_04370 [Pseudonocardia sp. SCN 72-51]ODV04412.1 MAG: hypothetical protein ABT15_20760 [Pseudonocardia sp. SCN 73-27]